MTTQTNTGSSFNPDMTTTEIAKCVRKEARAAFGKAWKFSVRTRYFAGGSSIDVEIVEAPVSIYVAAKDDGRHMNAGGYRHSKAGQLALDTLQGLLDSRNRQSVDNQSDYSNCRFYGSVGVDSDLRQRQLTAQGLR